MGTEEGEDYSSGHDDVDGPAASDATLVSSIPVTLNSSVSDYTTPCRTVVCSQFPARLLKLPKAPTHLLTKGINSSIPASTIKNMVLAIADTGATNHMCLERSAFISYHPVPQNTLNVRMGNKTLAPVLGKGTAIISLNGKLVLVRNVLHVPTLRTPLYSLRKHPTQRGYSFLGNDSLGGLFVYFPSFVLAVDTTKDCHLSYKHIGQKATLEDLDYVQPRCALKIPPPPPLSSHDWQAIKYARHSAKQCPAPIPSVTQDPSPQDLASLVPAKLKATIPSSAPGSVITPNLSKVQLLSTMSHEDIIKHMHHPDISLPEIRTCNTPTGSDKNKHCSAQEIHHATGYCKFKNHE